MGGKGEVLAEGEIRSLPMYVKYITSRFSKSSYMTFHGVNLEFKITLTSVCLVPGYLQSFLNEGHIMYLNLWVFFVTRSITICKKCVLECIAFCNLKLCQLFKLNSLFK